MADPPPRPKAPVPMADDVEQGFELCSECGMHHNGNRYGADDAAWDAWSYPLMEPLQK